MRTSLGQNNYGTVLSHRPTSEKMSPGNLGRQDGGSARERSQRERGIIPFGGVGPVIHEHPTFDPPQDRPLQGPTLKMMASCQTQSRKHGDPPNTLRQAWRTTQTQSSLRAKEPTNHPNTVKQTWRTTKRNEASMANRPNTIKHCPPSPPPHLKIRRVRNLGLE